MATYETVGIAVTNLVVTKLTTMSTEREVLPSLKQHCSLGSSSVTSKLQMKD